jgi:hypothetical protein
MLSEDDDRLAESEKGQTRFKVFKRGSPSDDPRRQRPRSSTYLQPSPSPTPVPPYPDSGPPLVPYQGFNWGELAVSLARLEPGCQRGVDGGARMLYSSNGAACRLH